LRRGRELKEKRSGIIVRQKTILIRADASVAIGTGHVMRCLALAQAWRQHHAGRAVFAMVKTTPSLIRRLRKERIETIRINGQSGSREDATATLDTATEIDSDWIVLDGYHFGANYQKLVKESPCKVLFIDDNGHAGKYYADLILNQNLHGRVSLYAKRAPHAALLLGPRYALLRREFLEHRKGGRRIREKGNRILIAMGGSDPRNLTSRILRALQSTSLPPLEIAAAIGGSNPHLAEIENAADRSRHRVSLVKDATDMAGLMMWADFAIAAAGGTSWEFCALALPALLTPVASNQLASARSLKRAGAALLFPSVPLNGKKLAGQVLQLVRSASLRRTLSRGARALVDARGAGRVAAVLQKRLKG
jgi:UDP-2,4-diacetamido-2,4,6-trideoxy-beta-L-altropyranose hydrolase